MYIQAPRNHQQPGSNRNVQRGAKAKNGYGNTAENQSDIHFSFEATLLYELINQHGDIGDKLLPWYFPDAYINNAETALGAASKIVKQAKMAGSLLDLNFVFNEIRQLNQIDYEQDTYYVHSSPLAQHLDSIVRSNPDFQPGKYLAENDREILEILHRFAIDQNHALNQVEDFALLYAISKWENQQDGVDMQLNGNTAKYLVQHHLNLIDPGFVPLLIDFYKSNKAEVAQRLLKSKDEN